MGVHLFVTAGADRNSTRGPQKMANNLNCQRVLSRNMSNSVSATECILKDQK
jgi:hypothetical protein